LTHPATAREHRTVAEAGVGTAAPAERAETWPFERFAGLAALAVAAGGLAYSIAFTISLENDARFWLTVQALALLLGGVAATAVFVGLYERLRVADAGFALWALALGLVGAFGSALHGGFDLANLANEPEIATSGPSYVDPRGLGTFALTGVAILVFSLLGRGAGLLPRGLALLGVLAAALLVWVYVGRLVILDPKSVGVLPFAVVLGFAVNPAWYAWLGKTLLRSR
jgi:hypothetical protein